MTIERFASRVGASLALGGIGLVVAAVICWASIGDGGEAVHSIHTVAGWIFAVFGAVMTGSGLAISSAVPARVNEEVPPSSPDVPSP